MVNKIKRFFKSLGGKHATSLTSSLPLSTPGTLEPFVTGPYGSSSSIAFHASTSRNLSTAELEARLETSGSVSGTTTWTPPLVPSKKALKDGTIEWGPLLAKIPQVGTECTNWTSPGTQSARLSVHPPFMAFLALLQQMAGRENQHAILHYYETQQGKRCLLRLFSTSKRVMNNVLALNE